MFARLRRRLRNAAILAASTSLLLTPLALADGEWCSDEPALVVDGQYVSITLVPHVPKANASQIAGAQTILSAPIDSHAQIVPTAGQHDFSDHTYLAPGSLTRGGPVHIGAVSVVTVSGQQVPVDVQIVVTDQSSGATTSWTISGSSNQAIRYSIDVP